MEQTTLSPEEIEKLINTLEKNKHELERILSDSRQIATQVSGFTAKSANFEAILSALMQEDDMRRYIDLLDNTNKYLREILETLHFDMEVSRNFPFIINGGGKISH